MLAMQMPVDELTTSDTFSLGEASGCTPARGGVAAGARPAVMPKDHLTRGEKKADGEGQGSAESSCREQSKINPKALSSPLHEASLLRLSFLKQSIGGCRGQSSQTPV